MEIKFAIFIVIGTLVVTAFCCSSTNFVSALETKCYSSSDGKRGICIHTLDEYDPPKKAITWCDEKGCTTSYPKEGKVTPEVKSALNKFLTANLSPEGLTQNSNPSLKNDKGAELSPDATQNSANDTNSTSRGVAKLDFPSIKPGNLSIIH